MAKKSPIDVSLEELALAFRKVKVDLFYATRACRLELLEYESKLLENLSALKETLAKGEAPDFGRQPWTLVPKSIELEPQPKPGIASDPHARWQVESEGSEVAASFRLMERLPISYHVFATYWLNVVGHQLEKCLGDCSVGNRLRRTKEGQLNPLSLGTTVPYLFAYRKWRQDCLDAATHALEEKRNVVVLSADIAGFYHSLDPNFLLDATFLKGLGVELSAKERRLHKVFVESLVAWVKSTPLDLGLPVGLSAASTIANVALWELDRVFEQQIAPRHYGRYVDDLLVVLEDGPRFSSSEEVWSWICARSGGRLTQGSETKKSGEEEHFVQFNGALQNSVIRFKSKKNKVFGLAADSGMAMLASIEREIRARSSEWRAVPQLPEDEIHLRSSLVSAIQRDGSDAVSFSRTDKVAVRRAALALKMRDAEAYGRSLPPKAWQRRRHAFLDAFTRHVVVLPALFDFFSYLDRVVGLALQCRDFEHLAVLITKVGEVVELLEQPPCKLSVAAGSGAPVADLLTVFRHEVGQRLQDVITAAFPVRLNKREQVAWQDLLKQAAKTKLFEGFPLPDTTSDKSELLTQRLFAHDLGQQPLKSLLIPRELSAQLGRPPATKSFVAESVIAAGEVQVPDAASDAAVIVAKLARVHRAGTRVLGLLNPTRPPSTGEFYLLHSKPFSSKGRGEIGRSLLGMRGFQPVEVLPSWDGPSGRGPIRIVNRRSPAGPIRIAVASWETKRDSWVAAVTRTSDPDLGRFDRLSRLVNDVLRCEVRPDYLVFPELSIPPNWFYVFAQRLQRRRISLIAGVEYLHGRGNRVRNQAWAALTYDGLGFRSFVIHRQDKQRPAVHEERRLTNTAGKRLVPSVPWSLPPRVLHGDFMFATLLCSELTNIRYLASLRGGVDAIFVPEWNRDITSFNALVEATALDVHCFVVQCNNRDYGDSRIRAPHQDAWQRDVVRVKGGILDYFVVGEIDVRGLRQFQSQFRSPAGPFKPVPDGFDMDPLRVVLP